MLPPISFILPTRNRVDNVREVVRIVQNEMKRNDEILILDDGTVGLWQNREILNSKGVRYVYIPHTSYRLGLLRNLGLILARNDFVIHLEDDLFPKPGALFLMRQALDHRKIIVGNVTSEGLDLLNNPISKPEPDPRLEYYEQLSMNPDPTIRGRLAWGSFVAYARAPALAVGGYLQDYDGDYGAEDIDFSVRMCFGGVEPEFRPEIEVVHRKTGGEDWRCSEMETPNTSTFRQKMFEYKNGRFPPPIKAPEIQVKIPHFLRHDKLLATVNELFINTFYPKVKITVGVHGPRIPPKMKSMLSELGIVDIRYLAEKNKGVGWIKKELTKSTTSLPFVMLDDDILVSPNWLSQLLAVLYANGGTGVVVNRTQGLETEHIEYEPVAKLLIREPVYPNPVPPILRVTHTGYGCALFQGGIFEMVRFDPAIFNAVDLDLSIQLRMVGAGVDVLSINPAYNDNREDSEEYRKGRWRDVDESFRRIREKWGIRNIVRSKEDQFYQLYLKSLRKEGAHEKNISP